MRDFQIVAPNYGVLGYVQATSRKAAEGKAKDAYPELRRLAFTVEEVAA